MASLAMKLRKAHFWEILSVVLLAIVIYSFYSGGNTLDFSSKPKEEVGEDIVKFINVELFRGQVEGELINVTEEYGLYSIKIDVEGEELNTYATKDGKILFFNALKTDEGIGSTSDSTGASTVKKKAEKPAIELYIFSYCPAGSSALNVFAPVADIFKDEADFRVRFFSHGHGEHEKQQNLVQECIQELEPNKYWDYANDFYEDVYNKCVVTKDVDCDKEESISLMEEKGIDSDKVFECVDKRGEEIYEADIDKAIDLQLRYSPSFVFNGEYLSNVQRTPEGIKTVVCSAFTEQPDGCEDTLSSTSTAISGSC